MARVKSEKSEVIELMNINPKTAFITIEGDSDLVLNKMNDVVTKALVDQRKDKAKSNEKPNKWEEIITSIHWRDGKPSEFTEESYFKCLKENAPCITTFGLYKSFADAVVRFGIDKYSTKFKAGLIVLSEKNLVPIEFTDSYIEEKLMSPKLGKPILARMNMFSGWRATFEIKYVDNLYSLEQIVNIINLAGFGLGIGSGRNSGYGRYHVTDVQ